MARVTAIPLTSSEVCKPVILSVRNAGTFQPAQHFTFATGRAWWEVTTAELEVITTAMQAARLAFLDGKGLRPGALCTDSDLRQVYEKRKVLGEYDHTRSMNTPEITEAIYEAIRRGKLIFVPTNEELRACVKAI